MVSEAGVRVAGLTEFRRALKLVDATMPKELARAHHQVGQIVADEAIRRAPAGTHEGGGTVTPIKRSIKALRRQKGAAIAMGGVRTPHAPPTEFGGTLRRHASRSRTTVVQRGFLYPAIGATRTEVIQVYDRLLDWVADKAFNQ